jgi:hypothetical protein
VTDDDRRPDGWERPGHWERPEPGSDLRPPPRSLQVAGVLLIGLGGMLGLVGAVWLMVAGALQLDPELSGQVDLEALGVLATVGFVAMVGGLAQVVAGIGVLRLRPAARVSGIVSALLGAVGLGLGAVFAATGTLEPFLRDVELSAPEGVILCVAIAGGYLIAAIALTQDWPDST